MAHEKIGASKVQVRCGLSDLRKKGVKGLAVARSDEVTKAFLKDSHPIMRPRYHSSENKSQSMREDNVSTNLGRFEVHFDVMIILIEKSLPPVLLFYCGFHAFSHSRWR